MVCELDALEIFRVDRLPYYRQPASEFPFPVPNIRGKNLLDFLPADLEHRSGALRAYVMDDLLPALLGHQAPPEGYRGARTRSGTPL